MECDLFENILSLSLQLKTNVKIWHAEVLFEISFSHNGGLVQTTPKCSRLKDHEAGVIDESPSGKDTLWLRCGYFIDAMCFLWLLTRKVWLANKVSFKKMYVLQAMFVVSIWYLIKTISPPPGNFWITTS